MAGIPVAGLAVAVADYAAVAGPAGVVSAVAVAVEWLYTGAGYTLSVLEILESRVTEPASFHYLTSQSDS